MPTDAATSGGRPAGRRRARSTLPEPSHECGGRLRLTRAGVAADAPGRGSGVGTGSEMIAPIRTGRARQPGPGCRPAGTRGGSRSSVLGHRVQVEPVDEAGPGRVAQSQPPIDARVEVTTRASAGLRRRRKNATRGQGRGASPGRRRAVSGLARLEPLSSRDERPAGLPSRQGRSAMRAWPSEDPEGSIRGVKIGHFQLVVGPRGVPPRAQRRREVRQRSERRPCRPGVRTRWRQRQGRSAGRSGESGRPCQRGDASALARVVAIMAGTSPSEPESPRIFRILLSMQPPRKSKCHSSAMPKSIVPKQLRQALIRRPADEFVG